ncbi:MlaC/ttg2D family ABC transporter substrate-binding protein [Magnetospirillum sulfuroxidans]|uniref:ABC transporter substrate-binding protein n=1 Tax=Magnetospirillum sulfuroxidans TaxID=611300 RepID=A0ABS5IBT9_9PROT|nr:ABC transporter substrate-binding protein [Magnetospirillum sulfuroxidans]MBR9971163.1 ABC transporter substrate-binding protein [Magnetospirillum sulfuroxidans]
MSAATVALALRAPAVWAAAADGESRKFIQNLADTAMKTVAVKDLSDAERAARFRSLFVNTFDLPEISKLVLGRFWRPATAEQRTEFQKLFEDIQVYTWTRRFKEYSGETLDISSVETDVSGDAVVVSQIRRQSLGPINVSWRVRQDGATFRVVDIIVEGASMIVTYRSDYSGVLSSHGGKLDGLLEVMRDKVGQIKVS